MQVIEQVETRDDIVTLRKLWGVVWRSKLLIVGLTVVCGAIAAVAAVTLPKRYEATIIVSPVPHGPGLSQSGLGSMLSNVGSVASSILGIGGEVTGQQAIAISVLQSDFLTEKYLQSNNLLPVLFPKRWDAVHQRWIGGDSRAVPTLWKAAQLFKKIRHVETDSKSGLVTMTIDWGDPYQAAKWANGLCALTNTYLRDQAIQEAQTNISFLDEEVAKTDVVAVKEGIYSILQNQISEMMLARGNGEYALRVVEPALVPELPASPRPLMWSVVGVTVGLAVGLLTAFVVDAWVREGPAGEAVERFVETAPEQRVRTLEGRRG